jgi:hypothetical protein
LPTAHTDLGHANPVEKSKSNTRAAAYSYTQPPIVHPPSKTRRPALARPATTLAARENVAAPKAIPHDSLLPAGLHQHRPRTCAHAQRGEVYVLLAQASHTTHALAIATKPLATSKNLDGR